MNRYPLWKYILLAVALLVALTYAVPNLFGEAPAVQISSGKATLKLDATMVDRVEQVLARANIKSDSVQFENGSVKARFDTTDTQIRAKDALSSALNPDASNPSYIVALKRIRWPWVKMGRVK